MGFGVKRTHCRNNIMVWVKFIFIKLLIIFLFFFLRSHLQHMEVSRLGAESELQPPAYTTATATWNPSQICELHHSSWQPGILNPLREARDQTHILMDARWAR